MNYTTSQWTPTYFVEVLGCTPLQTAAYMVRRKPFPSSLLLFWFFFMLVPSLSWQLTVSHQSER
jgi:hypothetical protein